MNTQQHRMQNHTHYQSSYKTQYISKLGMLILALGAIFFITSCSPKQEDISLYVLLEVDDYLQYIIAQYNQSQDNYLVKIRPIEAINLKDILLNNIQRGNLFLLITRSTIIAKAGRNYLSPFFPINAGTARRIYLNQFAQGVIASTNNYGFPLYIYDFDNPAGVSIATLGIPISGYNTEHVPAFRSIIEFLARAEINAQALMYNHVPVFSDALIDKLAENQQRRVSSALPRNKLSNQLQPIADAFVVAP